MIGFATKCKRSITARARAVFFDAGVAEVTSNQKIEQVLDVEDVLHCSRILSLILGSTYPNTNVSSIFAQIEAMDTHPFIPYKPKRLDAITMHDRADAFLSEMKSRRSVRHFSDEILP